MWFKWGPMWFKEAEHVSLIKFADFFIQIGIEDVEKRVVWRLLGVYASTDDRIRRNQWKALQTRILTCQEVVLVMGDFNDILNGAEK